MTEAKSVFSQPVPPEGDPKRARFVLIGEAPGKSEAIRLRPFVGPAGKTLSRHLSSAGIIRSDCLILNTIPVYPARGLSEFITFKGTKITETPAYKQYEEELIRQVNEADAKIVIPFGRLALYALTRRTDITKRRGSILTDPRLPDKLIVPTIHPSAAFRQYNYNYYILFDLKRARELADGTLQPFSYDTLLEPTLDQTVSYLSECLLQPEVCFDIEVLHTVRRGKFQDSEVSCLSIGFGRSAICIPFVRPEGTNYWSLEDEKLIWKILSTILEDPDIRKVGQNILFDASFLLRKGPILIRNLEDTMAAAVCTTSDFPKGLDFLTSIYTTMPYYKDEGKAYRKLPSDIRSFWQYSANDSVVLSEIITQQRKILEQMGNLETYQTTTRLIEPLMFMGERGILLDKGGLEVAAADAEVKIAELLQKFKDQCGRDINPRSPKQLCQYFYEEKKLKPYLKDGSPTVDADALIRIAAKGITEAQTLLSYRKIQKLHSTYLTMAVDTDNRIRSTLSPMVTVTGRLSSRRTIFGTGGNLQNLPKSFRRYLLPDPGYIAYEADLSQAENRLVAIIAPEPTMQRAFSSGTDVHSLTGALISGKTVEEVMDEHERKIPAPIGGRDKSWRHWGKTSNHALNYGLGAQKFALRCEITLAEANLIREAYYQAYPGITKFHNWIAERLREDRTLTNFFGRKRKFMGRLEFSLFQEAFAHIPQSTVADIINRRAILPIYYDQDRFGPVVLLNQVHDSIVFEISEELPLEEHARLLWEIKKEVEQPLLWKGDQHIIPLSFSTGRTLYFGYDFDVTNDPKGTAENIRRALENADESKTST